MKKSTKNNLMKLCTLLFTLSILFGVLSGCGKTETEGNSEANNISEKEDTGSKLPSIGNISSKLKTTTIVRSGLFSEGLCFIELQNEEGITYCIDKKGDIKFKFDGSLSGEFINGLAPCKFASNGTTWSAHRGYINYKGDCTYAEDVGVTNFYSVALYEGYIIAEIVTSTFDSTKNEVGIMNTDFEWVVQPSEDLYKNLCGEYGFAISASDNYRQAYNGYYYIDDLKAFLELETGELHYDTPDDIPLEAFGLLANSYLGTYVDYNDNIVIDLSEYSENANLILGEFINGYAPILFANNKSFFTLINSKGEFQFEPVEIREDGRVIITDFEFDGEYMLLTDGDYSHFEAKCFNAKGELVGEWDGAGVAEDYRFSLCDGVIIRAKILGYGDYEYTYFNPDFTPLF